MADCLARHLPYVHRPDGAGQRAITIPHLRIGLAALNGNSKPWRSGSTVFQIRTYSYHVCARFAAVQRRSIGNHSGPWPVQKTAIAQEVSMKRLWIIPVLVLCGVTPALAGASSENRLDNKALEGPEGKGSHSTDPNVERSGSPGPKGPSDQTSPSNKPAGSQFNDYGTGSGATGTGSPGATGAGSSSSGSSSGTSDSGTSGSSDMKNPGSGSEKMQPRQTP